MNDVPVIELRQTGDVVPVDTSGMTGPVEFHCNRYWIGYTVYIIDPVEFISPEEDVYYE